MSGEDNPKQPETGSKYQNDFAAFIPPEEQSVPKGELGVPFEYPDDFKGSVAHEPDEPAPEPGRVTRAKQWFRGMWTPSVTPQPALSPETFPPVSEQEVEPQSCPYSLEQAAILSLLHVQVALLPTHMHPYEKEIKEGDFGLVLRDLLKQLPRQIDQNLNSLYMPSRLYDVDQAVWAMQLIQRSPSNTIALPSGYSDSLQMIDTQLQTRWDKVEEDRVRRYTQLKETRAHNQEEQRLALEVRGPLFQLIRQIERIDPDTWGPHLSDSSTLSHPIATQIVSEIGRLRGLGLSVDDHEYQRAWKKQQEKFAALGPNFALHDALPVKEPLHTQ